MKRLLTLLALASLSAAAGACGDDSGDDGDDDKGTPKNDASVTNDAGGKPAPRPVQITNVGAECTATTDCQGPGALECLSELDLAGNATELPGGYCTAECEYSSECGEKGGCPVAEIIEGAGALLNVIPNAAELIKGFIPSNCIETCTGPDSGVASQGTCSRSDHLCQSFTAGLGGGGAGGGGALAGIIGNSPALKKSYCFPPVDVGDAGVRNDAGASAIKLTGLDAGI
jgi:hypothetical protein